MTPKQIETRKKKIAEIKRILAAEKRKYGGYDDSRGRRYLPLRYFIEIQDYVGGYKYLQWFYKNFPDDVGLPDFLFESMIILYYSGMEKEAATKAIETFESNTYLLDKFLGRFSEPVEKWESSNMATADFANLLPYSAEDANLRNFVSWLNNLYESSDFKQPSQRILELHQLLKVENDVQIRRRILKEIDQIVRKEW